MFKILCRIYFIHKNVKSGVDNVDSGVSSAYYLTLEIAMGCYNVILSARVIFQNAFWPLLFRRLSLSFVVTIFLVVLLHADTVADWTSVYERIEEERQRKREEIKIYCWSTSFRFIFGLYSMSANINSHRTVFCVSRYSSTRFYYKGEVVSYDKPVVRFFEISFFD